MIKQFIKYHLRNGKLFERYCKELKATEKYSVEELQQYQNEKLQYTIRNAYENVPFYRRVLDARKLKPSDIRTKEDLQKLPIINKKTVQDNFKNFRNKNFKGLVFKGYTSGTTGAPGTFLRDLNSINFENAAIWRLFSSAGKTADSRRVTLRGDIVCPIEKQVLPFWKFDHFSKQLLLSSYHINDNNLAFYIKEINKFNYYDLYAYPSTAYLLAEYCLRNKIALSFAAVFTSSELVSLYQREAIEKAFKCKLFDWYGQAERVSAIGQCKSAGYHIQEDYSVVELKEREDGFCEMIGTTFNNVVMPLIRYRTGDIIKLEGGNSSCLCHSIFRKVKVISGREGNSIRTPDKRTVGILNHIPRGVNNLIELQFVQKQINEVILRIVCTDKFSKKDEDLLLKNTREHISQNMDFVIEKVKKIERGKSGKFIPVVSKIE